MCTIPGSVSAASALTGGARSHFRRALQQHTPTKEELNALYVLDHIYKGDSTTAAETEATQNRAHQEVYNASGDASESIYGEIQPTAVLEMMQITGVKEGQKYYDLGSGYGKTVVLAWLLGLNATGVELATERWESSCEALHRASSVTSGAGNGVNMIHASFFDVDFSDADLVFMDSVMFSEDTMKQLAKRILHLRVGTKIVSSHMGLPGPGFKKLGEMKGKVSWTHRESRWTVQEVGPGAAGLADSADRPPAKSAIEKAQVCKL